MELGDRSRYLLGDHPSHHTSYLFHSVHISRARKLTVFGASPPGSRTFHVNRFNARVAYWNSAPAIFIAYLEAYFHFRKHGATGFDAVDALVW